jgi:Transmembrane secretion effector
VQDVIPVLTTEEQRLAANSVGWSTGRLVQILASAVAGAVIAVVGTGPAFAINAASFVVSALLISTLRIPAHAGQLGAGSKRGLASYFADALNGLGFARQDGFVSRLVLVQALASFATGATGAMLVVLSERHLHLPPAGFAWLIGAIGVGALIGPLIPNLLAHDYRDARWLFVPYVVRGIGDVLIAIFTPLPVALGLLFIYGLNTSTGMVVFNSTVQGAVPDAVRGRVFTLLDVTWNAMRLVSLALGGVIVDAVGVEPLFWAGGCVVGHRRFSRATPAWQLQPAHGDVCASGVARDDREGCSCACSEAHRCRGNRAHLQRGHRRSHRDVRDGSTNRGRYGAAHRRTPGALSSHRGGM